MKPKDGINHVGNQTEAAKALRVSQPAIAKWVANGNVPELRQYQIEKITKGKLKCESPVK